MRKMMIAGALALSAATVGACATNGGYASQCERDYAVNRERATASGAILGAAIGAALAGSGDREKGAALGAVAGGLLGNQLTAREDPCGYGFGGYNTDGRYGYDPVPRRGDYGYY